jgi:hypothetical protein
MWGSLSRHPSEGRQPGAHFFAVEEVPCVQRGHFGSPLRRCRLMPSAVTIEDLLKELIVRRLGVTTELTARRLRATKELIILQFRKSQFAKANVRSVFFGNASSLFLVVSDLHGTPLKLTSETNHSATGASPQHPGATLVSRVRSSQH